MVVVVLWLWWSRIGLRKMLSRGVSLYLCCWGLDVFSKLIQTTHLRILLFNFAFYRRGRGNLCVAGILFLKCLFQRYFRGQVFDGDTQHSSCFIQVNLEYAGV